jgi:hypothetical protein
MLTKIVQLLHYKTMSNKTMSVPHSSFPSIKPQQQPSKRGLGGFSSFFSPERRRQDGRSIKDSFESLKSPERQRPVPLGSTSTRRKADTTTNPANPANPANPDSKPATATSSRLSKVDSKPATATSSRRSKVDSNPVIATSSRRSKAKAMRCKCMCQDTLDK